MLEGGTICLLILLLEKSSIRKKKGEISLRARQHVA